MDLASSTPTPAPMMHSPVLSLVPSHMPASHLESALSCPALSGLKYHTPSPDAADSHLQSCPLIA
eukprot:13034023-Alexandrium_andersonii.AAC.1